MSEKTGRLFYWEEAYDSWVPAPDDAETLFDFESMDDGEITEVRFKRVDMTDEEYDKLPEV